MSERIGRILGPAVANGIGVEVKMNIEGDKPFFGGEKQGDNNNKYVIVCKCAKFLIAKRADV